MPTIMTNAESDYTAAYNNYMEARAAFYAGKLSPEEFIVLRNAMESALAVWEADRRVA